MLPNVPNLFTKYLAPTQPDAPLLEQLPSPTKPLDTSKPAAAEPRVDLGHSTHDKMQPRLEEGFWAPWQRFLGIAPKAPSAESPSSDGGQVGGQVVGAEGWGQKASAKAKPDLFDKVKAYKAFESTLGLGRGSTPEQARAAIADASAKAASDPNSPVAAAIRELAKTVGTDALGSFERFIQQRSEIDAKRNPAQRPVPEMPGATIS